MFKVSKKTLEQYQKYSTVIIAEKLIITLNWQLKSYKTSDVDDKFQANPCGMFLPTLSSFLSREPIPGDIARRTSTSFAVLIENRKFLLYVHSKPLSDFFWVHCFWKSSSGQIVNYYYFVIVVNTWLCSYAINLLVISH